MKTEIVRNTPAVVLRGNSGYSQGEDREIFREELIKAPIGEIWGSSNGNCARDSIQETAILLYRDGSGCLLKIRTESYDDSPDGKMSRDIRLVWVEF
jgi:hypothetical protein